MLRMELQTHLLKYTAQRSSLVPCIHNLEFSLNPLSDTHTCRERETKQLTIFNFCQCATKRSSRRWRSYFPVIRSYSTPSSHITHNQTVAYLFKVLSLYRTVWICRVDRNNECPAGQGFGHNDWPKGQTEVLFILIYLTHAWRRWDGR